MTAEQVSEVFRHLIALRPECADGFARLRDGLLEDFQMNGGPVNMRPLTEAEVKECQRAAQNYCDRMASVIRGLSFVAGHDFPELGERFGQIADKAASVLEDYKTALSVRDGLPLLPADDTVDIGGALGELKGDKSETPTKVYRQRLVSESLERFQRVEQSLSTE